MPNKTKIEWTDYTSNGVTAHRKQRSGISYEHLKAGWFCDKPDADGGCLACYAESINLRWGNGLRFDKANRKEIQFTVRANEIRDLLKLNVNHPGSKVFVADMFDLFQPSIDWTVLGELFECYDQCDKLTLQFLTKYPARMSRFFSERYGVEIPKHFWVGMSAANQEWFNRNVIQLGHIQGLRFLSLEPLLSAINIKNYLHVIDWVIIGGESGTRARICDIRWIRDLVEQCKAAGVPCFVKQFGSNPHTHGEASYIENFKGGDMFEWPQDLRIRQMPEVRA